MKVAAAILLVFLALIWSTGAFSQPMADLAVDVDVDPSFVRPPGTVGTVTVNLSNLGPDAIQNPLVAVEVPIVGFLPVNFFSVPGEPCTLVLVTLDPVDPTNPVIFVFVFSFPALQPGEMMSCQATFVVSDQLMGQFPLTWEAARAQSEPQDPNPANDASTIVFGLPLPTAVPTLGLAALMLMLFLMSVTAFLRLR